MQCIIKIDTVFWLPTEGKAFIMKNTEKRSILIIDDSESNIMALTKILSSEYNINIAKNGLEGIEIAKKESPDIIILDIIMPKMDGFETITALKKSVQTRKIPVIFITGLSKPKDEEKGLALGAAEYISKPFSPEIVKLRVRNQISILTYIQKIESLSSTDQMTGLPSRRSFDERLYSEWKRAMRDKTEVSLLLVDVDNFKKVNDTFGHLQGDIVLQSVAKVIARVPSRPADYTARWGGEEFIVLLPSTDSKGATYIAEQLRRKIDEMTISFSDGQDAKVTVSIGVNSHKPKKGCSVDDFLNRADKALYKAKDEGRNKVANYFAPNE